ARTVGATVKLSWFERAIVAAPPMGRYDDHPLAPPGPGRADGWESTARGQRFRCPACRRTCTSRSGTPLAGHRWPPDVVLTAGRWYLRDRLSLADVRDLRAARAWIHTFGPLLAEIRARLGGQAVATRPQLE